MPDEQQQQQDDSKKQKPKVVQLQPEPKHDQPHPPKPDDGKVAKQVIESLGALKNRIVDLDKTVSGVDKALAAFGKTQGADLREIKTTVGAQDDRVAELAKAFAALKADLKKDLEEVLKRAESQPSALDASIRRVEKMCASQIRANSAMVTRFQRPVLGTASLLVFGVVLALAVVEGLALWRVYG